MTFGARAGGGHGVIRTPEVGVALNFAGWSMRVMMGADDTSGRVTVPTGGMAPHVTGAATPVHTGHGGTFIVLDGRLRFRFGDAFCTALPGGIVRASRHLAHGVGNPFDTPARYVVILTPSGCERYFADVVAHVAEHVRMPSRDATIDLMTAHDTMPGCGFRRSGRPLSPGRSLKRPVHVRYQCTS